MTYLRYYTVIKNCLSLHLVYFGYAFVSLTECKDITNK